MTIIAKQVGTEMVLLDYDRGIYYGLNPIGAQVWQLLHDGRQVGEIVNILTNEYEAPAETIQADVEALLRDLRERGLLPEPLLKP